MSAILFRKDPRDRLDYDIDYSRWLTTGDVIQSASATMDDSTATVEQVDAAETAVKVWVDGGAVGETGTLTVRAATAQGRIKEISVKIQIREA